VNRKILACQIIGPAAAGFAGPVPTALNVICDYKATTVLALLTVGGSDGLYCFRLSFFSVRTITHEPLHLARWNFARTCSLTTARNSEKFKVIGQRSRSQDRIFEFFTTVRWGKKVRKHDRPNSWTAGHSLIKFCTHIYVNKNMSICRTLLNFKVISQRSTSRGFLVFFCVHDATRGQYLALSKAWRSCLYFCLECAFLFFCATNNNKNQ